MKRIVYIIICISLIVIYFKNNDIKEIKIIEQLFSNTFINENLTYYIVSINDLKYNINIEGVIDNVDKIKIKIPYHISNFRKIDLDAYKQIVVLDNLNSSDNESNSKLIFSYPKQIGLTGEGYINATLEIDDENSTIPDKKFKTKQLEIEKNSEYTLAKFNYPNNLLFEQYGILEVKVISGIKDRMYGISDNSENMQSHNFIYYPIISPITGKIWLNNNLGAEYSNVNNSSWTNNPFQQAKSIKDINAYGSLFQWGRKGDGHEFRSSQIIPFENINAISDNPDHNFYITSNKYPYDWRTNENNALWNNDSINNVCPQGWRLPSKSELENEFKKNLITNNNHLKLTMAGYRLKEDSYILSEGLYGNYWTKDIMNSYAYFLLFNHTYTGISNIYKSAGFSVRCIKN